MIENEIISLFRRCTPSFQKTMLYILNAGAEVAEMEAEERHKAAHSAQIIPFKPRAATAKEV